MHKILVIRLLLSRHTVAIVTIAHTVGTGMRQSQIAICAAKYSRQSWQGAYDDDDHFHATKLT